MLELFINQFLIIIILLLIAFISNRLFKPIFSLKKIFYYLVILVSAYFSIVFILIFFHIILWLPIVLDINLFPAKNNVGLSMGNMVVHFIEYIIINFIFIILAVIGLLRQRKQ